MILQKALKLILLSFMLALLAVVAFWGMQWFANSLGDISKGALTVDTLIPSDLAGAISTVTASQALPIPVSLPSGPLDINAQAALSVKVMPGVSDKSPNQYAVLFQKNGQKKLPVASLTKLMTALVVLQYYDLKQNVMIDKTAMAQVGEQGDLKLDQVLSVKDLLYITLIESSNRSAYALSQVMSPEVFVGFMNSQAKKLGLVNTHFEDTSGLSLGSYSTAQDLVKLTQYLFDNYPLFREIISLKSYDLHLADGSLHHTLHSTNELLGQNNIVGGKTGFTNEAKGCFMAIQQSPGSTDYVINVVLGSDDRFLDMKKMIER